MIYSSERKFNMKKRTTLHIAIGNNSKKMIELLISQEADINAKDIKFINKTI